jgi:uncharacterized protein GlcG (DUF336 family)
MISLANAQVIVEQATKFARDEGFPPMTIAVLDAAGNLVSFAREDSSSLLRERIARGKAYGTLAMGMGSRSLARRAQTHPEFVNSLVGLTAGYLVPVAGGVLVRDAEGLIVGAVGVSGHGPDEDERCAVAGIEGARLRADPGE